MMLYLTYAAWAWYIHLSSLERKRVMCDFISWKKDIKGNIYFLTDKDVFSPHGRETLRGTMHNDILGHSAIDAFYGPVTESLPQFENRDFWDKTQFPPEIAIHLESPETLFDTWSKMLKRSLQPDDASYILIRAPELWRSAFMDICIPRVAEDVTDASSVLCEVGDLPETQKDILIEGVAKSAEYASDVLRDVKNLTNTQKGILVRGLAKNPEHAHDVLYEVGGLTRIQKDVLIKVVTKEVRYAYRTLRDMKGLTRVQKDVLVKAVAKNAEYSNYALYDVKNLTKTQQALLRRSQ
ncbi:MAG: hypothetical protein UW46_C0001G0101 [Candidatus Yanofskybacteria bacterium GW2011_GWF1_44_227]|uniref:Uncharacterized protein n=1 Tax=Candidatus Yanofskybacteria bacterium GW2011_GWE2_40_11 TaxID=1619033 RepID=A0A0G0TTC0_9BACT|nr:MAG: hypothetical protein UT69_C0013G0031 [Candidatus Yanofskybacteria bacterium GW2011_GWE1_40_10]KKR41127.1 MAG: hypothetical protein UT75_C0001G0031 [Candidatus Yanofskybacteria bacterium GW2011_GWE2_40_11]KKT15876.1 MAG: hypothetical protein UV97_C0001G0049 [Candidatus Yanofskybacteria bacterium GW2011_GWF2_43_596]KKT53611.1 MAG: hypothetical protein UW46_C0001G0101 [Candidatus Yanofskybacteria bacterium GW2011_GWF1_44_227]OGN36262.1 MAG: hypothetical protein A2241_00780 [Candidatus Yano